MRRIRWKMLVLDLKMINVLLYASSLMKWSLLISCLFYGECAINEFLNLFVTTFDITHEDKRMTERSSI